MIQGFRDPETKQVFRRERARRLPADVQRIAQINLQARHDLEAEKDRLLTVSRGRFGYSRRQSKRPG